jgi:hypothetical protein
VSSIEREVKRETKREAKREVKREAKRGRFREVKREGGQERGQEREVLTLPRRHGSGLTMDLRRMGLRPGSIDVCIDKGTLDVFELDRGDPWRPAAAAVQRFTGVLESIHRCLTADGKLLSLTFAQPHFRRRYLQQSQFDWSVDVVPFGTSFHYFAYFCKRGRRRAADVVRFYVALSHRLTCSAGDDTRVDN